MNQKQELKYLYHSVYNLSYHLVIVTKYRKKCIDKDMLSRLEEIFRATLEKWEGELLEFNGEADHVHLLISVSPKVQLSRLINNLKTVSSRLIRKEFATKLNKLYKTRVFWNRSYCILSCGGAPLSVLKQYIENQELPD
jgi:putative transposase